MSSSRTGSIDNLRINRQSLSTKNLAASQTNLKSLTSLVKKSNDILARGSAPSIHTMTESTLLKRGSREYNVTGIMKYRFKKQLDSPLFCVKFSFEDDYFAAGTNNGSIEVYHILSGSLERSLSNDDIKVPCTSISFRPNDEIGQKSKNVLVAGYADGSLIQWHFTSGKVLYKSKPNPNNQINCISYCTDGKKFVTGGSDFVVRVYDDVTKKCIELRDG
jgi:WD40 repeat protein